MSEVLFELPEFSTSVFVLLPQSAEEKVFVTIVDKKREGGRKLPGGGSSKDRAIAISAVAEIYEEVGLTIHHPTDKLLEVHKVGPKVGPNGSHHWVAVRSLPPVIDEHIRRRWDDLLVAKQEELGRLRQDTPDEDLVRRIARLEDEIIALRMDPPLVLGEEIERAWWENADTMRQAVAERKFFTDHGRAVKWYISGAWSRARALGGYDRAEEDPLVKGLLDDILLDRGIISRFIDKDGCLVLCYDPACEICDRPEEVLSEPEPEETMETLLTDEESGKKMYKPLVLGQELQLRELRSKPTSPEVERLVGEIEVMLVTSDRFDDELHLFVRQNRQNGYIREVMPYTVTLKQSATAAELAKTFGMEAERQVSIPKTGRTAVLLCGRMKNPPSGFVAFNLNSSPPNGLIMGMEQAKTMLEALERFNRIHGPQALWVHGNWQKLPGLIKFKEEERRRRRDYSPTHA